MSTVFPSSVVATETASATLDPATLVRPRLDSPDFLRGIVMVVMALDHVRDFFTSVRFDPLDLEHTTASLFLTRWITHFCAPTFVFLAGAGAWLYGQRGRSRGEVSRFLLTRGLWLVVLEMTAVRWGWFFNFNYSFIVAQVIWVIGWAMVVLAGLSYALSTRTIAIVGVAIIVLHNLLNPLVPEQFGALAWVWTLLHEGGFIRFSQSSAFFVIYPLLPWIGVICAGYGFGALLVLPPARRRRVLLTLGLSMTAAFVLLGLLNVYGDTTPWTLQRTALLTVFSFLDVQKYPPALLYVLMTLGPAITALPLLERVPDGVVKQFFVTFGRVPLFYYLLHIVLIHLLALVIGRVQGFDVGFLFSNSPPGMGVPPSWGFGLPMVYLLWACVVLLLYPLCRWFARVKMRSRSVWLSYL